MKTILVHTIIATILLLLHSKRGDVDPHGSFPFPSNQHRHVLFAVSILIINHRMTKSASSPRSQANNCGRRVVCYISVLRLQLGYLYCNPMVSANWLLIQLLHASCTDALNHAYIIMTIVR